MTPAERALAAWESGANVPRRPYSQPPRPPQPAQPKPGPKSDGEFLSVEEAAAIIGMSKMTIYRAAYLKSCMVEDDQ